MSTDDKKTGCIKVWVSEPLELELRRLADRDDRKLSDYIGTVLRRHVWGHVPRLSDEMEGPNRAE
jgi:hypothetical protein